VKKKKGKESRKREYTKNAGNSTMTKTIDYKKKNCKKY